MLATPFLCLLATALPQGGEADRPTGLTVVVVDVGQGDGVVVRAPDGTIHVVDAGPNGQGTVAMLPAIQALQPVGYGFTFLSHFHDDHQGGLDELLQARPFQLAYDRGDLRRTNTSAPTNAYLGAAGNRRRTLTPGLQLSLGGGALLRCVAVNGNIEGGGFVDPVPSAQEENSRSVALRLDYGQFSMWLGGDLTGGGNSTSDVESPAALACGDVDVYKLNHHGSNTSTNTNLVTRLDPELCVVSCGTGNTYGHPTPTITNRLVQAAALRALYSTTTGSGSTIGFGVTGSLRIDTDGRRYRATAANGDFLDFWCDEVAAAPPVGALRVAEIHRNPAIVADTNGEYVEVVNIGSRPFGLSGVRLADGTGTITLASNLMAVPGRPILFQVDGAPSRNGGQPLGVTLPFNALALGDTSDTVALSLGSQNLDTVAYGSGWPGGSGVAMERRNLAAAATAANHAAATQPFGSGDLGSPGRRNPNDSTPHPVQVDVVVDAQGFTLHGAALAQGGRYSVLAAAFGSAPGFPLWNAVIPLNYDPLLQAILGAPGAVALLPAEGYRSLRLALPAGGALAGVPVVAAHAVLDLTTLTVVGVSPPKPFTLP